MESIDPYLKTLPEFESYLPIRCRCGKVLGKYQELYEKLSAQGTSVEEMYRIFKLENVCCKMRIESPDIFPYNVKPITSMSYGRESSSATVGRIFTTKTFDDVSNKKNRAATDTVAPDESHSSASEIDTSGQQSSYGVFEVPKPQVTITQQESKPSRTVMTVGKSTPIVRANIPTPLKIQQISTIGRQPQPIPLRQITPINPRSIITPMQQLTLQTVKSGFQ